MLHVWQIPSINKLKFLNTFIKFPCFFFLSIDTLIFPFWPSNCYFKWINITNRCKHYVGCRPRCEYVMYLSSWSCFSESVSHPASAPGTRSWSCEPLRSRSHFWIHRASPPRLWRWWTACAGEPDRTGSSPVWKTIQTQPFSSACSSRTPTVSKTHFSLSPSHLDTRSEEDTEKKVELLASVATALAR